MYPVSSALPDKHSPGSLLGGNNVVVMNLSNVDFNAPVSTFWQHLDSELTKLSNAPSATINERFTFDPATAMHLFFPIVLLSYCDLLEMADSVLYLHSCHRRDAVLVFAPHFIQGKFGDVAFHCRLPGANAFIAVLLAEKLAMEIKIALDRWCRTEKALGAGSLYSTSSASSSTKSMFNKASNQSISPSAIAENRGSATPNSAPPSPPVAIVVADGKHAQISPAAVHPKTPPSEPGSSVAPLFPPLPLPPPPLPSGAASSGLRATAFTRRSLPPVPSPLMAPLPKLPPKLPSNIGAAVGSTSPAPEAKASATPAEPRILAPKAALFVPDLQKKAQALASAPTEQLSLGPAPVPPEKAEPASPSTTPIVAKSQSKREVSSGDNQVSKGTGDAKNADRKGSSFRAKERTWVYHVLLDVIQRTERDHSVSITVFI